MEIKKYPLAMRLFHWTISSLVIFMLILGFALAFGLDKTEYKGELIGLHKSLGILILLLVIFRVFTRFNYRKDLPEIAGTLPWYEHALAKAVHYMLYLFLFIMPLSGYLMSAMNPKSVGVFFFGIALPNFLPKDEGLSGLYFDVHEVSAYILCALIFLHLSGVVKHRLFDKPEEDSLSKML